MTRSLLITGCSSGIGRHAALAFRDRGWRVFATCRAEEDAAGLRAEGLEAWALDYGDEASIETGYARAVEATGGTLDGLFNNGAYALPGALEDMPAEAVRQLFEANFIGWHALTRLAIRTMRKQGHGRIVMNSSILGFTALRMRGPYIASKFALEGYTDTLRLELNGSGIHAILLQPGPIGTMIRQKSQPHYERWIDREASHWRQFYTDTLEPRLYAPKGEKDPFELTCEATTRKLIHAFEAPRPRARYPVTTPTYIAGLLKRVLPTRAFDALAVRA